ncbi:methyltransferase domain-containing protein [Candidatus Woesearchaeota archaeon]|nr:methyltransferase domain-containing protein [Candidatus Woesearchaeota archaeon]
MRIGLNNLWRKALGYPLFVMKWLFGIDGVQCNLCGWWGRAFKDLDCGYGQIHRKVHCPRCESDPRHRTVGPLLKRILPRDRRCRVLDVSPIPGTAGILTSFRNVDYLSIDIDPLAAMRQEDLTRLSFPDSSFDFIYCSHVLEHVSDGRKAMGELYRVLRKGGCAIIAVPIDWSLPTTFEDASIVSPEARDAAFGQWDHVRLYGRDFPDQLRKTGFSVKEERPYLRLPKALQEYHLMEELPVYVCSKT